MNSFADIKTASLANIIRLRMGSVPEQVLVVGCGAGIEAAVLAEELSAKVIGIDINSNFDARAALLADLRTVDATNMCFEDNTFDFVYSYHALEHIPDYRAALQEMQRVLRPGGGFLIGTPNRNRIIGYLGSKNTSIANKIKWNFADWQAICQGKFRNEYGAHAGYSIEELQSELQAVFSNVDNITPDYYLSIYAAKQSMVKLLFALHFWRWLLPAIYFCGKK